jgi:trimethylamine--corrinoid protein Co-methyltransferase
VAAAGLLEDALTSSAEQLVIDNEILGMIFRAVRGIGVTGDSLGLETIMRVGIGGSYLTEPHTLAHMRHEYFQPRLAFRPGAAGMQAAGVETVVEAARDRVQAILNSHRPAPLPKEVAAEIQHILVRAAQHLDGR